MGRPPFIEEKMQKVTHILNKITNLKFNVSKDLLAYAGQEPEKFKLIYSDTEVEAENPESYTEGSLKAMNMKDLQTLVDSLELTCDKRRKEEMIDAILKHGRG